VSAANGVAGEVANELVVSALATIMSKYLNIIIGNDDLGSIDALPRLAQEVARCCTTRVEALVESERELKAASEALRWGAQA
jgi:hypothetical protein